jgi:hypothetical protein
VLTLRQQASSTIGPLPFGATLEERERHEERIAAEVRRLGMLRRWHEVSGGRCSG